MMFLKCLQCAVERTLHTYVKCEVSRTQINTQHVVQKLFVYVEPTPNPQGFFTTQDSTQFHVGEQCKVY